MIVQLMSEPVRWRSPARLGSAMFTAVMSRMTISCAMSSTNSRRPFFLPAATSGLLIPWW